MKKVFQGKSESKVVPVHAMKAQRGRVNTTPPDALPAEKNHAKK